VPQNFVISYSYDLPFGRGRKWAPDASGVAGVFINGWQASGITTFQSGRPLQITVASSLLNNNGTSNPADLTCNSVSMPKTVGQWFNTGCFAAPPAYKFGNSNVGHVYGPGINNWDCSLAKTGNLRSERTQLRFEASFFNLFIQAHFANPNNLRHGRVWRITSTSSRRALSNSGSNSRSESPQRGEIP